MRGQTPMPFRVIGGNMDRLSIHLILLSSASIWDYYVVFFFLQTDIHLRNIMIYKIFGFTLHFRR